MHRKVAIIIMDGWGHGPQPERSAIAQARVPFVQSLYSKYSNTELITYGEDVGLPEGQMGNSEVGHLNIGAGRVVYQDGSHPTLDAERVLARAHEVRAKLRG